MTNPKTLTVNGSKIRVSLILLVQAVVVAFICGVIWMDLKAEMRNLGVNRWTKVDDQMYMLQLGRLNPSVDLPVHLRSTSGNIE